MMRLLNRAILCLLAAAFIAGSACAQNGETTTSAETEKGEASALQRKAGRDVREKINQAASKTGHAIETGAAKTGHALEKVGAKIERGTKQALH
jgi:hypothetical protein